MSISKPTKITLCLISVAIGLSLNSMVANAVTTDTTFSTNVPKFQQSHYWDYQQKTRTGVSAVQFDFIGSNYLMNVKAQNGATLAEYAERIGISESTTPSPIANGTPIGTATRLIVTNNTWALVEVLASGFFRTN